MSDEEIYRQTEAMCRARPGLEPEETWRARLAGRILAALDDGSAR